MPSWSRGRFLLFAVPLSAVLIVLLGVVSGGARPFRSARVYGGPTQGLTELSLRIEVGERDRIAEVPVPGAALSVVAIEGGQRVATARAKTDSLGITEIALRLPRPRESALELWVDYASEVAAPLAKGLVLGSREAFRAKASRRGGFQRGRYTGELELSVAPAHGVLVTAQGALDDELLIRAERAGGPVIDARIGIKLEGAEPAETQVRTDAAGLARLKLRPNAATVRVALDAVAEGIGAGTLAARLNVVQGAIRVTRRGEALSIESGGAATLAYLGFFDESRRYLGLRVPMTPAPDGRLVAELPWPAALTAQPLWVVASSQADLASPSAVGWPTTPTDELAPRTFDARELLLLDGAPAAALREAKRERRVRLVTVGYAAMALLFTLLLFVKRVRDADAEIGQHLSRAGVDDDAAPSIVPASRGRVVLAAACIGLGFLVLALLALFKE
ncbi:MAG TPA: hypothetical protein VJN18_17350 [Polyangiaceae bacterium]|nr:hypothetical protein [Polyangiaceae bacterium]